MKKQINVTIEGMETETVPNKLPNIWSCTSCKFSHIDLDVMNKHINETHTKKKGSPIPVTDFPRTASSKPEWDCIQCVRHEPQNYEDYIRHEKDIHGEKSAKIRFEYT